MLIPPNRQMKSVTTQTQMLPQGCKVTHTEMTHRNSKGHTHTLRHTDHACTHYVTQHPRIQGPCLSTLVIMVNSWACYPMAAYGCLIALLGYIKTYDCTFRHAPTISVESCDLSTQDQGQCILLSLQDKNAVQFLSNT